VRSLPPFVVERLADGGRGLTVLVIRFGALGDILRTLPAVRLIRAALSRARLVWAVDDRWRAVIEDHPDLDGILALPRFDRGERWSAVLASIRRWREGLREPGADLVLDFHGNLRSGVAGWLSSAPVRLGYAGHQQKEGNRILTTHRVDAGSRRVSRVARNLSLVRALGIPCDPLPAAGLVLGDASLERARGIVRGSVGADGSYAVLSPGASRRQAYKRPPERLLAAAVGALDERGIVTLVVYGPGEESDARRVVDAAPRGSRLAPPTDLRVLAALLRGARAFVGGDTGPLHLACATGCPVVGIYGPTDPVVNSPWGVPHRVVFPTDAASSGVKKNDRRVGRFEEIPPEAVAEAVRELIDQPSA
jgi:ADP-heptose:LPS heptosyltransferase